MGGVWLFVWSLLAEIPGSTSQSRSWDGIVTRSSRLPVVLERNEVLAAAVECSRLRGIYTLPLAFDDFNHHEARTQLVVRDICWSYHSVRGEGMLAVLEFSEQRRAIESFATCRDLLYRVLEQQRLHEGTNGVAVYL